MLPSGNSNDLIAGNADEQPGEPLSSIDPSIPDDEPGRKGMYHAMLSARAASEGKMEEARSNAETALQLLKNPSNDSEFHARGVAQQELGNYDLAIVDFDKALQLDPKQAIVYVSRGTVYRAILYFLRGNEHFAKRNFDLALTDLDKGIKLDPKDASAYHLRGAVYAIRGELNRAVADFDMVIQLDPKQGKAYLGRGRAYYEKGDHDRAIADLDKAIELSPQDATELEKQKSQPEN
jgi:tetratricopeptide (TPR) repeat protein